VQATFFVGLGGGQLVPGGRLRFIPGERGTNVRSGALTGAGGGGGSGLLYTTASNLSVLPETPSLDLADANTSWVLLAVAGGGGGAGLTGLCEGAAGKGGSDTESGTSNTNGLDGGTDGAAGDGEGSGGGYRTGGGNPIFYGRAGSVRGGKGGEAFAGGDQAGGFGYGGGGAGSNTVDAYGGGGGGFSGGAGWTHFTSGGGGGGGSFANAAAENPSKESGDRTNKPRSGYIEYVLKDTNSPVAVCSDLNVELDENGTTTVFATDADGGSYDPNGNDASLQVTFGVFGVSGGVISLITFDEIDFDCTSEGTNSLFFLVLDEEGLQSSCQVDINVEDNIPPTALCQSNLTLVPDESGVVTIAPADLDNGSFDNCGVISLTASQTTFTCDEPGIYEVNLYVSDASDNVSTCTTTVEVRRFIKECPSSNLCVMIPEGDTDVYIEMPMPTGELGCGVRLESRLCFDGGPFCSFSETDKSGIYGPGEYLLTWRYINESNQTFGLCVVNIRIWPAGTFSCPPTTPVVQLDANGTGTLAANALVGFSTDGCGILSETSPAVDFTCADLGPQNVVLTVIDVNNNQTTVDCQVNIEEPTPLQAMCRDITVQLEEDGEVSIDPLMIDNGSTSTCPLQRSLDKFLFTCADQGPNTVTLTVDNAAGQESTCMATVTVEINNPPTARCRPAVAAILDEGGTASLSPEEVNDGSVDFCQTLIGPQGLSLDPDTLDASDGPIVTVTLTVTDANGNTDQCTSEVYLEDPEDPVCSQLASFTAYLDETGTYELFAEELDNGSTDNSGILNFSLFAFSFENGEEYLESVVYTCDTPSGFFEFLAVTDGADNRSLCSATVLTILDTVPPLALCKNVLVELDENGQATINSGQVDNGTTDNCELDGISLDQTSFTCADVGDNTVTLTATDASGNEQTCTATVTVEDNVLPTIVCLQTPPVVQLDSEGTGTLLENILVGNLSTDNCAIDSESSPMRVFSCDDVGTQEVALTVHYANGNSDSKLCQVIVEDKVKPTVVCPETPLVLQLDENDMASLTANALAAGLSTDNCGVLQESSPAQDFSCNEVGTQLVLLTVEDINGNLDSKECGVEIVDNERPVAICPELSPVVSLDADGMGSLAENALDVGLSTDNCAVQSETSPGLDFTCEDVGNQLVLLTVEDVNGNLDLTECMVEVVDNVAPIANCQDVTVQLNAEGLGSTTAAVVNNGSTDACGIDDLRLNQTFFTCAEVGMNEVTLTVIDNNEQEASCTATVTVEDNIAPNALCQNVTVQLGANGSESTTAAAVGNGSSDACGIASLSLSQTSFDCSQVGANMVTLTVTDDNDNVSTCTATVTVEDNIEPTALCQNVTVQLDASGNGSTTAAAVDNGSGDACGIASWSLSPTSFDCSQVGANTVTLTVNDNNGNSSICNATVTVQDNVAPTALCQNVTVQVGANGNGSTTAAAIDNGSGDACGIASLSLSQSSFDCSQVGANTVTLTVNDNNGNTSTCNATVTVQDNVAPTALCQDVTVQLGANGSGSATAAAVSNGSGDACGIASWSLSQSSFDCSEVGANMVTLTVTDDNDNVSTCTATVTVEDNIPPDALCQDVTVQLGAKGNGSTTAAAVGNGSSDACGIASVSLSQTSFDCSGVGANMVTLTVTDDNGNVNTCNATVTVEEGNPPVAVCGNLTVNLASDGTTNVDASLLDGGSSATCGGVDLSASMTDFDCNDVGNTYNVTLTVTSQANGQSATCTANVTVADPNSFCCAAPMAVCDDITVQLDANGNASIDPADIASGSTAECGLQTEALSEDSFSCADVGPVTITYTITDVNGNIDNCSATVTVQDNVAPDALCQNVTVQLEANGNGSATAAAVDNGSSDACGIASLALSQTSFGCAEVGGNSVTLTVTDNNGNLSTCTAMVTVEVGTALPPDWSANDIGNQGSGSDYAYDPCVGNNPSNGDFTVSTGGYNLIPQNSDNLAFASVPLCGNGGIQARIENVSGGYAGLMIRESSAPGAKMVAVYSNLSNLLRREIRTVENGQRSSSTSFAAFPKWLRLVRQGNYIQAFYRSSNGGNWTSFYQTYLPMGNCVEMGLAVFTTDPGGDASAVFSKVNYQSQGGQSLSTPNTLSWEAETPAVLKASVLPNPVRGAFTLQFSKPLATAGQAVLRNQAGQALRQRQLQPGDLTTDWNASDLPAGLYFMGIATEDGYREVLKVIRQ
jgi:hypothetical protein